MKFKKISLFPIALLLLITFVSAAYGYTIFVDNNHIYGEIFAHKDTGSWTGDIITQNEWINLSINSTDTDDDGGLNNGFTLDEANSQLITNVAGRYKVSFSISTGNAGNNQEYQFIIGINGVEQDSTDVHRKIGASGDVGNAGSSGFIDLNVNDVVKLQTRNNDGTADLLIHAINVNLIRLGSSPPITVTPTPPALTILLNSTSLGNTTSENLTVFTEGTGLKIFDWRINGTSMAKLNTPFENHSTASTTAIDYSTYGNNGTIRNTVTWTAGCLIGGCYDFDGSDDDIDVGDITTTEPATVMMWMNPDTTTADGRFFGQKDGASTQAGTLAIKQVGENHDIYVWNGGAFGKIVDNMGSWAGEWHHLTVVYYANGSAFAYWDGDTALVASSGFDFSGVDLLIGGEFIDFGTSYNGKMDEVKVFNRTLTLEQIRSIYNNETDIRVSQTTSFDENWTVQVTPTDSNGNLAALNSNPLVII